MKLNRIQDTIIGAMKEHDTLTVETLRGVVAAVKKTAIDKKVEITDKLVDEVLLKETKIVQEMIDTCPKDRNELLNKYKQKMVILTEYVPTLIDNPVMLKSMIIKILAANQINWTTASKGIIMRTISPQLKGVADMKVVNIVVTELMP